MAATAAVWFDLLYDLAARAEPTRSPMPDEMVGRDWRSVGETTHNECWRSIVDCRFRFFDLWYLKGASRGITSGSNE